ncbi:MAG: alpha/beta hydrolase [Phycisphaerales bacterium]|nr:alpha/beta hydrolase [Phycisphaerales bacterium]
MSAFGKKMISILGVAWAAMLSGCNVEDLSALRLLPPFLANAPSSVHMESGLTYAEHDGQSLLFDLYRPVITDEPTPLVVVVFGGGWRSGSRDQLMEFAYDLAAHGYAAAAIDYRLADGTSKFPDQVIDVLAAVEFLRENADRFGVDPARVGLFGASAGAHLSLLAGMAEDLSVFDTRFASGQDAGINVIVNLFGPTDLTIESSPETERQIQAVENFLGSPLDQARALRHLASPIEYVRADGPAVFTVHGRADMLVPVSQARNLIDAMATAGQEHTYIEIPGMGHTIAAIWISFEAQSYRAAMFEFLAEHL